MNFAAMGRLFERAMPHPRIDLINSRVFAFLSAILFHRINLFSPPEFMKHSLLTGFFAALALCAYAQDYVAGDRLLDFGIGVGSASSADGSKATFTQRIAVEWIAIDNLFGASNLSLGTGLQINNAAGGRYSGLVTGSYDYKYDVIIRKYENHRLVGTDSESGSRKGHGVATCDVSRDNISLMPTVSLHGNFGSKLDLYATFGLGMGLMTNTLSGFEATRIDVPGGGYIGGFEEKDFSDERQVGNQIWKYSGGYRDIDHAEWNKDGFRRKLVFATSLFIGARYFVSDSWALGAQLGLLDACVDRKFGNSYNIFSLGATYLF